MSVFDSDYKLFDNGNELHDKIYEEIDDYIGKIYSLNILTLFNNLMYFIFNFQIKNEFLIFKLKMNF